MESTLKDLGSLLIQAIPTILFFILLTVYLNAMLFKPLARVLEERRRQTEGARELAQEAFAAADQKTTEWERALQLARTQIQQEHDALRRQWSEEEAAKLAQARAEASQQLSQARAEIGRETEQAEQDLQAQVEALSAQISNALLRRRAA